jgi:hypothetical protein
MVTLPCRPCIPAPDLTSIGQKIPGKNIKATVCQSGHGAQQVDVEVGSVRNPLRRFRHKLPRYREGIGQSRLCESSSLTGYSLPDINKRGLVIGIERGTARPQLAIASSAHSHALRHQLHHYLQLGRKLDLARSQTHSQPKKHLIQ